MPAGPVLRARVGRPDLDDTDAALSLRDLASWSSRPPVILDVWRAALGVKHAAAECAARAAGVRALGETLRR